MKRLYYIASLLTLLATAGTAHAKTWTINFGVGGSLTYEPSTLSVNVGDVIVWSGDFTNHPLSSTSVPAGASSFQMTSGGVTTFSYTVTTPGSYAYHCNIHFSFGMVGSFTASAGAGVENPATNILSMDPIFPNPANNVTMVHFTLDIPSHVRLLVYDGTGRLVTKAADQEMDAGFHMLTIDTKQLASGSYQYVLQAGEAVLRREMIVVR
ncbi:MAG: T9SS type A sorting domain-containing protein [Bacteroidota bacterium]|nr:T9SS type A sorting domain-containing protein [Bacteroidota bacterium]MDP4233016.1 T9SS type A sorting domain-containing protein [Bacteroidota bacterium]MDP4241839.1 T9SS type A sorting domain-containing protein [Bacteroidota bacterium]MDP4288388.1 T9SS type A sorting domain-containing protein [Bacteroidota bacterium]